MMVRRGQGTENGAQTSLRGRGPGEQVGFMADTLRPRGGSGMVEPGWNYGQQVLDKPFRCWLGRRQKATTGSRE